MNRSANPPFVIHNLFAAQGEAPPGTDGPRLCAEGVGTRPRFAQRVAPTSSPLTSPASIAASAPRCRSRAGGVARPVCAPKVVANDANRPTASPTRIDDTLSRPTPPNASGTSAPSNPSSHRATHERRASAQFFSCSDRSPAAPRSSRTRRPSARSGGARLTLLRGEDGISRRLFDQPRAAARRCQCRHNAVPGQP